MTTLRYEVTMKLYIYLGQDLDFAVLRLVCCKISAASSINMETMETEEVSDVPELLEDGNSSESGDDSDWKEEEQEDASSLTTCLFCGNVYRTEDTALSHCFNDHNFNLVKLKEKFKMDCYSFIRLINYIRKHQPSASTIMEAVEPLWEKEEYMKPVIPDDPWLMIDFDDIEVPSAAAIQPSVGGFHVNAEGGCVTMSEQHFTELQRIIQHLKEQVEEKQELLNTYAADVKKMQRVTQELIGGDEPMVNSIAHCVKDIRIEDDEGYFSSYSHFSIHHEMLSDRVRTLGYQKALCSNSSIIEGKSVLDLGCGTGILSMFAASAGARKVVGIDQSDIIYHAMDIVRENNMTDKISLVKSRIEDSSLPQERYDIIVSEWMGYLLLFEGMLDSVIYARDHYLAEGGLLLPNRCSISLVGASDPARHSELVGFWTDVYGYRMSCLKKEVIREATIEVVPADKVITEPCVLKVLDMNTCSTDIVEFSCDIKLEVKTDGILTAFVGYFDVFFDLPNAVNFSTGPHSQPTHWKQSVFLLEEPITVKQGVTLNGQFTCQRCTKDVRSLKVSISFLGKKYKYTLS